MSKNHWKTCIEHLERELPAEDFNTWILPLQVKTSKGQTVLQSPNEYVRDYIAMNHLERVRDIFEHLGAPRESVIVDVSRTNDAPKPGVAPGAVSRPLRTGPSVLAASSSAMV